MAEQQHGDDRSRTYLYVFLALAIFTALEVGVSYLDDLPEALQLGALVALAVSKIALVVLWFMHLRYDRRVFAVPFVLGLLLVVPLVLIVAISLDDEGEAVGSTQTDMAGNAPVSEATPAGLDTAQGANVENAASTLEITQGDSGLELSSSTVGAGDVQIRVTNESQETQQLSIVRPDFVAGMDAALAWSRRGPPL